MRNYWHFMLVLCNQIRDMRNGNRVCGVLDNQIARTGYHISNAMRKHMYWTISLSKKYLKQTHRIYNHDSYIYWIKYKDRMLYLSPMQTWSCNNSSCSNPRSHTTTFQDVLRHTKSKCGPANTKMQKDQICLLDVLSIWDRVNTKPKE